MMRKYKSQRGSMSLEASIAVTMFIFFMLFLYSFFVVFEARNEMAHVLLATTNSMSLDPLQTEKLDGTDDLSSIIYKVYSYISHEDNGFIDDTSWANGDVKASDISLEAIWFKHLIKERFVAYLAGGDEEEANAILERYHIEGGLDGLDFSGSYIDSGNLYISVKYTIEYEFNMFNLGKLDMEQSACSKLWK